MYRLLAALLATACAAGCSKSASEGDLCARRCKKLVSCARGSDLEEHSCTQACAGVELDQARVTEIEHMSCEQLAHVTVN